MRTSEDDLAVLELKEVGRACVGVGWCLWGDMDVDDVVFCRYAMQRIENTECGYSSFCFLTVDGL